MTHCSQGRRTRSGVYNFDLSNNIFLVFIGDFNDVDKSRSFFQGTAHSDIGMQLITSDRTIFTYEETRYKELNGGKVHRCYRINHVGGLSSEINTETNNIVVIAPAGVILATEEPPLDLTTFSETSVVSLLFVAFTAFSLAVG